MNEIWKKSKFSPPKINIAISAKSGEKFAVIEDDTTIFKLINGIGQIYVVAGFRCKIIKSEEGYYYSCEDPIHPISCSKVDNPREKFAENLIKYIK